MADQAREGRLIHSQLRCIAAVPGKIKGKKGGSLLGKGRTVLLQWVQVDSGRTPLRPIVGSRQRGLHSAGNHDWDGTAGQALGTTPWL